MSHTAAAPLLPRSDTSWFTEWRRTLDWGLVAGILLLAGIGLLMSLAVGPTAAAKIGYEDPYHYLYRQAVHASIGIGLMLAVSVLERKWARRLGVLIFAGALLLMAAILGVGHEVNGAQSWFRFSAFSVQPSEQVKPGLIVLCAWLLSQRERYPDVPWALVSFVFFAVTLGLFLLQPDVGGAALISAAFVVTFFVSGLPKRWIVGFAAGGAALAVLLYNVLPNVKRRVDMIFNPSSNADTFQIDMAGAAISRGGLFGTGPGEGLVKTQIPEAHTDFIFAVIAEEFGLVAIVAVMAIYGLIAIRGFRAAARIEDGFARTAAAGLFALFAIQAVINIGVNLAIVPPTGLTLPFISYGGSAMVGMGLTLGLALALVRGEGTRSPGPYG
ncbi:FtsW/RodA/SpoVE family cell cycle protein [Hyphomonas sp.]|uniref:FtsW/RodA/SpoVE family cell cycle protein n=1 Tax=Hyphomonas sp. TaxID=87 RepID=UPI0037BFEDD6